MIELDHRAEKFLDSIRDEGQRDCTEIRAKTEAEVQTALELARREDQAKTSQTIRFETARSEVQGNKALSAKRAMVRGELAAKRQQLQQEIFAEAETQVRRFTESCDYAPWLIEGAQKLARTVTPRAVIYARTVDLPLLQGVLPEDCRLVADDTIHLGGLRACGSICAVDDTLESRLARQYGWFLAHSGLSIAL